jgi:hypothetical protein
MVRIGRWASRRIDSQQAKLVREDSSAETRVSPRRGADGHGWPFRKMRNRSLLPKPWWQVGLTILPGLIFLNRQVFSTPTPSSVSRFLLLAALILLSTSSVLLAAVRRSLLRVPSWGFVPLGLLAGLGLIWAMDALGFYPTCCLLVVTGLVFARHNGPSAGLFVLAGLIVTTSWQVEPVMYFWDSPFWRISVNAGMTVLFTILTPILVLRSRSVLEQAVGLLLPVAAYYVAFVFALCTVRGFPIGKSVSIAGPIAVLFATTAVAATLYAWISSRSSTTGPSLR